MFFEVFEGLHETRLIEVHSDFSFDVALKKRLASVNLKTGKIRLDPSLKGNDRRRVKVHMKTYLARRRAGDSFSKAVRIANKRERGSLSLKEWRRYNGRLGALARWHSRENR